MRNNAHLGETKEQRLARFQNNPPLEVIETLLLSIQNYFNNEIRATLDNSQNPQTSLMILGVHSVALTVAHGFFNKEGETGYKLFLEHYVDGNTPDTKFSSIAAEIHEWRNILAHRWLNVAGHDFSYEYNMPEGWRREGTFLLLNPRVYLEHYLRAFESRVYRYEQILNTPELLEAAKQRIISKYTGEA